MSSEKAIEDMSLEEIKEAREELRRQREALEAESSDAYLVAAGAEDPIETLRDSMPDERGLTVPEPEDEEDAPEPWPHDVVEVGGISWQTRKPNESALMAVSMVSGGGVPETTAMRVFSKFLQNHMSEESFARALEEMTDSESPITLRGLVRAMAGATDE